MCLSIRTHNCTLRLVFLRKKPIVLHLDQDQGKGDEWPMFSALAFGIPQCSTGTSAMTFTDVGVPVFRGVNDNNT